MKRWGYWLLAVVTVYAMSGRNFGTDVAELRPVEVVSVSYNDGTIAIRTDTGDYGMGADLKEAVINLQNTTPAEVFLDTAEYLLIDKDCEPMVQAMVEYLRPSCGVCVLEGDVEMEMVAQYLRNHKPINTLCKYRAGEKRLQTLRVTKGRMELVS